MAYSNKKKTQVSSEQNPSIATLIDPHPIDPYNATLACNYNSCESHFSTSNAFINSGSATSAPRMTDGTLNTAIPSKSATDTFSPRHSAKLVEIIPITQNASMLTPHNILTSAAMDNGKSGRLLHMASITDAPMNESPHPPVATHAVIRRCRTLGFINLPPAGTE